MFSHQKNQIMKSGKKLLHLKLKSTFDKKYVLCTYFYFFKFYCFFFYISFSLVFFVGNFAWFLVRVQLFKFEQNFEVCKIAGFQAICVENYFIFLFLYDSKAPFIWKRGNTRIRKKNCDKFTFIKALNF